MAKGKKAVVSDDRARVGISLNDAEHQRLAEAAAKEQRTIAGLARVLVLRGLEELENEK
jgi:hypothetical protein